MERIRKAIAWVSALRPIRVFIHFLDQRGFLLAAGLSFQSIFAVFAGIWVGFASAGLILRGSDRLSEAFFTTLARSVPGLLSWNGRDGVIDPAQLMQAEILGWTGAIAAVGLLFTAVGWLSSARDAVRALFNLPGERMNFVLLKLKDFALMIGFGAALIVSAALSVFSTQALGTALGWFGLSDDSMLSTVLGRIVGLVLMLVLDTVVLGTLYRVLSGLKIPMRRLVVGSLLGAIALGILKVLGSLLLGGAGRNPLLAGFAIIIGLLIWFNLICVVILLGASWIAVGMSDAGIAADPKIAAERREQERLAQEKADAERAALARRQRGWFRRLLHMPGRRVGRDR
ncbi:membrane protein [Cryobacterium mesophilum]|uniref:YihY/virulence factor BrkB family protein n=1 Tax=Terrimesophilobacter mesophilus TaxID=433647 RepID=UPI0014257510|nr:YihY/virulence factor BrkB family protein [Terrimesophilobacter mesophilus]MBB5633596.1 membrane protein [Terrimesophilobacter mesophilus]